MHSIPPSDDFAAPTEAVYPGLTLGDWLKAAIIGILMITTFRFNLYRLLLKANPITGEGNWGHAVFIPIIGLYYLYLNREQLFKRPQRPLLAGTMSKARFIGAAVVFGLGASLWFGSSMLFPQSILKEPVHGAGGGLMVCGLLCAALDWGIGLLLFGLLIFQFGIWPGRNDWTSDMGMVITLFGVTLLLCGWDIMRIAWFPIVFLTCAIPWPPLVYSKVAGPLQELAARVAVATLNLTGVDAVQAGTKIFMPRPGRADRALNVAEACAGLRSLMTFVSLAAALAFLSGRSLWQKLVIVASAVPIAIFCNVMRVSGQGLLDRYASEAMSEGFAHQFVGLVMLMPAFFLILLVGWILDQVFIEELDVGGIAKTAAAKSQTGIITAQRRAPRQTVPGEGV